VLQFLNTCAKRSLKPTSGTVIFGTTAQGRTRHVAGGQIQPVAVQQYLIMFLKIGMKKVLQP